MAGALEQSADAQARGELADLNERIEEVRRQVVPINDIPRPIFKLALRFWKDWALASLNGFRHQDAVAETEWPELARIIAGHVRTGSMPNDRRILDNFVRRRRALNWRDMGKLFGDRS